MNAFQYDEDRDLLAGVYNLNVSAAALHAQVMTIMQNRKDRRFYSMASIAYTTFMRFQQPTPVSGAECGAILGSTFDALASPLTLELYEKEALFHVQRVDSARGPMKIAFMEAFVGHIRKYMSVSICYQTDASGPRVAPPSPIRRGPIKVEAATPPSEGSLSSGVGVTRSPQVLVEDLDDDPAVIATLVASGSVDKDSLTASSALASSMGVNVGDSSGILSDHLVRTCGGCGGTTAIEDDTCTHCGLVERLYLSPVAYMDSKIESGSSGGGSSGGGKASAVGDDKINFMKRYAKYKGEFTKDLPAVVVSTILDYFDECGIQISDVPQHRIDNIQAMYSALATKGLTRHNCDVTLVCHKVWGWPLPEVGHLDARISEEFDQAQAVIDEYDPALKPSNVVNAWRLYRHLVQAGHDCDHREFKLPKTRSILAQYETMWDHVCRTLDWENPVRLV